MKIYDCVAEKEFTLAEEKEIGFYMSCSPNHKTTFTEYMYLLFSEYFDPEFGQCDFHFVGLTDKEIKGMTKRLEKKI